MKKIMIANNGLVFHHEIFHIYSLLSSKFACIVEFDYLQQRQSYRCLSRLKHKHSVALETQQPPVLAFLYRSATRTDDVSFFQFVKNLRFCQLPEIYDK